MLRTVACGIVLVLVAGGGDEAERRAALGKAADLFRRLKEADAAKKDAEVATLLPEFTAAIQAAAPHLPTVPAEETAKPRTYHKLTLNADRTRVDGFRFRTPAGTAGWDLDWEFVIPNDAGGLTWNLTARAGTVDGFKNFIVKKDYAEKGADLPKGNRRYVQRLPGGRLKAGAEYIVWFAFDDDRPVDARVRLGLTPAKR